MDHPDERGIDVEPLGGDGPVLVLVGGATMHHRLGDQHPALHEDPIVELDCSFTADLEHQMAGSPQGLRPTVLDDGVAETHRIIPDGCRLLVPLSSGMGRHLLHQRV